MPSLRKRRQVNYKVRVSIESSDDERVGQTFSDESDDFEPDTMEDQPDDEEALSGSDLENSDALGDSEFGKRSEPENDGGKPNKSREPASKDSTNSARPGGSMPVRLKASPKGALPPQTTERAQNDSLRSRMHMIYGDNETNLVNGVDVRLRWGSTPIITEIPLLKTANTSTEAPPIAAVSSLLSIIPVLKDKVPIPASEVSGSAAVIVNDIELSPGNARTSENIAVLNTGFHVSACEPSPSDSKSSIMLAVGVLDDVNEGPINAPAARPSLSITSTSGTCSTFFIYRMDLTSLEIELKYSFASLHGPLRRVKWRPVPDTSEILLTFQDGFCCILALPRDRGHYEIDGESKLVLTPSSKILSATWNGPFSVVAGTFDGKLAEFDILAAGENFRASLLYPIHSAPVVGVESGWPEHENLIFSTSIDGYCKLCDLKDIQQSQAATSRARTFFTSASWCPLLESFISFEDEVNSRAVPVRRPTLSSAATSLTRHSGTVSVVAAARNHPFILSGGSDGEVHLVNAVQRLLVPRQRKGSHKDATLWALEASDETSTYRLLELLQVNEIKGAKNPAKLTIYPKQMRITGLSWIEHATEAWYAASTASGLVRIERLSV